MVPFLVKFTVNLLMSILVGLPSIWLNRDCKNYYCSSLILRLLLSRYLVTNIFLK